MMNKPYPDRNTVERIRRAYPAGCRVVLDHMGDDPQALPDGSQATVLGVDDTGSVMCAWDCGGSLSLVYGVDRYHRVHTQEEARTTLDWYGKNQSADNARCPRCGLRMEGPTCRQALSRWAEIMVCSQCGGIEALEKAGFIRPKPLLDWAALACEGPWRG